jgi:hypothetical protein
LEPPVDWLLEGESFVRYRTWLDLAGSGEKNSEIRRLRRRIPEDPPVRRLLESRNRDGYWGRPQDIFTWWPGKATTFWVLGMLADFGLTEADCGIRQACEYVFSAQLDCGGFGLFPPPKPYECFTGILTESLAGLGYTRDRRLKRAYRWLAARQRLDGGFWCKDTGQPGGRRQDEPSCAFATLCVLGALTVHPRHISLAPARRCTQFLLDCWKKRGKVKYAGHDSQIGTGWEKLKYPFTDYRILKYMDIMTRLPQVARDPALSEMAGVLTQKADSQGRYTPESVHRVWSAFDFGQKRHPSRWLTFLAYRILKRLNFRALTPAN